jgi:ankyrin repeat protein
METRGKINSSSSTNVFQYNSTKKETKKTVNFCVKSSKRITGETTEQRRPRSIRVMSDHQIVIAAINSHDNAVVQEFLQGRKYGVNAREIGNNNTGCHLAVLANNKEAIKIFYENEANINEVNANDYTPLMLAIKLNADIELIKVLLECNADINKLTYDHQSALTFAIQQENQDFVHELVQNGADINFKGKNGYTPLHYAIETENLEVIKLLICKDNINQQDYRGCTPIHLAIRQKGDNCIYIIESLIKNNANIEIADNTGKTPLHYAYIFTNIDAVYYLISQNADRNAVDNYKSTILHFLARNPNYQKMKSLEDIALYGIDIDIIDNQKNTPLYYAITQKNFAFINKLLSLGANMFFIPPESYSCLELILLELNDKIKKDLKASKNIKDDIISQTILACLNNTNEKGKERYNHTQSVARIAIIHNLKELLTWLYNKFPKFSDAFKFDPISKDNLGCYPLHIAAERNSLDAVKVLLNHVVDVNVIDQNGKTAIHHAVECKKSTTSCELIQLLIKRRVNINVQDCLGNTALFYAAKKKNFQVIQTLLDANANVFRQNSNKINDLEFILKIIEAEIIGANKESADIITNILKQVVALNPQYKLINLVIKHDCCNILKKIIALFKANIIQIDLNQPDDKGNTALHHAIFNKNENIAKVLLLEAINRDAKNHIGMTAIHYASQTRQDVKLVKLLLDCCANACIEDNKKYTPLYYAIKGNNIEAIQLLIDAGSDVNIKDDNDNTPLHTAVTFASEDAVKLLLNRGADVSLANKRGQNPFHQAIDLRFKGVIKILYDNGQDKLFIKDDHGRDYLSKIINLL